MVSDCDAPTEAPETNKMKGWRRSVEARHFIMTLKDHFLVTSINRSDPMGSDGWAVKYIDVRHTRSILEAFDDDASGFVTIDEVNSFTQSRPSDWRYTPFP